MPAIRFRNALLLSLVLASALGCSGSGSQVCAANADCGAGQSCVSGVCVLGSGGSGFSFTPSAINFSTAVGGTPGSATTTLTYGGASPVIFTIACSNGITASPANTAIGGGGSATITIAAPLQSVEGTFDATCQVSAPLGASGSLPVTITVAAASSSGGGAGGGSGATCPSNPSDLDTWNNYAQAAFASECVSCHSHDHSAFANYAGVSADAVNIQSQITGGFMPEGGWTTASDQQRILAWISCGLPQGSSSGGGSGGGTAGGSGGGTAGGSGGGSSGGSGGGTAGGSGGGTAGGSGGGSAGGSGGGTAGGSGGGTAGGSGGGSAGG